MLSSVAIMVTNRICGSECLAWKTHYILWSILLLSLLIHHLPNGSKLLNRMKIGLFVCFYLKGIDGRYKLHLKANVQTIWDIEDVFGKQPLQDLYPRQDTETYTWLWMDRWPQVSVVMDVQEECSRLDLLQDSQDGISHRSGAQSMGFIGN